MLKSAKLAGPGGDVDWVLLDLLSNSLDPAPPWKYFSSVEVIDGDQEIVCGVIDGDGLAPKLVARARERDVVDSIGPSMGRDVDRSLLIDHAARCERLHVLQVHQCDLKDASTNGDWQVEQVPALCRGAHILVMRGLEFVNTRSADRWRRYSHCGVDAACWS